jgi:hypothetical protein
MSTVEIRRAALQHVDHVLEEWARLAARYNGPDFEDLPDLDGTRFITRALAAVERIGGQSSVYATQARRIIQQGGYAGYVARHIVGVVESLRTDLDGGFLDGMAELIHGEVFGDYLERAEYLLGEDQKDAAAVIAGSSLEVHLRHLCAKHSISSELSSGASSRPKKADQMNSELTTANAYSKLDQKNVTAWLDLRNRAAHCRYDEYQAGQVGLMIAAIRDFIARTPA